MLFRTTYVSLLMLCILCCMQAYGQHTTSLRFLPEYNGRPLTLDESAVPEVLSDSLRLTTFRFYISGITLLRDEKPAWTEAASYHLIDAAVPESLELALPVPAGIHSNAVRFHLGIDSATNAGGAQGGDLDATKGMYWAWQSGYINFKLEGTSPACRTRRHAFQFHLGGFGPGKDCLQTVLLPVSGNSPVIVSVDINAFLSGIDLAVQNSVMIPGADAVMLSGKAAQMFHTGKL